MARKLGITPEVTEAFVSDCGRRKNGFKPPNEGIMEPCAAVIPALTVACREVHRDDSDAEKLTLPARPNLILD